MIFISPQRDESGYSTALPVNIYALLMSFASIRVITFDCYGTLVDWENGILDALRPLLAGSGRQTSDQELLKLYGEIEARLEAGPYLPYREVLAQTAAEIGRRLGVSISSDQGKSFAESIRQWKPFPDTVAALQKMAGKFRLGIISNIDDDLFAETRKKLAPVEFDFVVTAQQMESYKPSFKNFHAALERSGAGKDQVLHAGQSLYHDVAPANALGIRNVWVNRPSINPGSGAARPGDARPNDEVHNLAELAALVAA